MFIVGAAPGRGRGFCRRGFGHGGFGGDLQEHGFERAPPRLQRRERGVAVAQEAREVGDAARASRRRVRRTPPAALRRRYPCRGPSAFASTSTSRPASATKQISSPAGCRVSSDGRAQCREPTAGDDRDAIAQRFGFVHRVRGEQNGHAAVAQLAHEVPRGRAGVRVHARGGLVEEHDSSGLPTSAHASESRCAWPPDSRRTGVPTASRRPDQLEHRVG